MTKQLWPSRQFKLANIFATSSIILTSILICVFSLVHPILADAALCQSIFTPAYSYPNPPTFWDGAITAKPPLSIIIANVNMSPETTQDSYYVSVIDQAEAAGVTVLGYVWTNYGAQDPTTVKNDINNWKSLYGVNSIFLDGASSHASDEIGRAHV